MFASIKRFCVFSVSITTGKHVQIPVWPTLSSTNRKYIQQIVRALTISSINTKARYFVIGYGLRAPLLVQTYLWKLRFLKNPFLL